MCVLNQEEHFSVNGLTESTTSWSDQKRLLICFFANRYEEVEVRKKLEEKERQELQARKEEKAVKDVSRASHKGSSANAKKVGLSFILHCSEILKTVCNVFTNPSLCVLILCMQQKG